MEAALFTKVFKGRSLEKAFEFAAHAGYDAVELMCREPHFAASTTHERARELRERLDDLGLAVAGMGTYTGEYVGVSDAEARAELEELESFLELADVMGTDLLRHGVGGPPERHADPGDYEEAAEWYREAADLAADYDKRLGIEIHANTITETAESTVELLEAIDRDNVGAIHDAGNMYIVGADYAGASLETLGDHLFHAHVKDVRQVTDPSLPGAFERERAGGTDAFQHRLMGHGDLDHRRLFEALEDAGYDGYLSNECHRPTDEVWTDRAIAAHEREAMDHLLGRVA
jgi:sugar phosphate isomerase/epimerase